ncbi:hypothetical protein HanPSC8_Chr05g0216541 [Helianthus annuus]|nr:hypothetical protein HanPSC8_Chr05g0216541 [Helianthus annuus]
MLDDLGYSDKFIRYDRVLELSLKYGAPYPIATKGDTNFLAFYVKGFEEKYAFLEREEFSSYYTSDCLWGQRSLPGAKCGLRSCDHPQSPGGDTTWTEGFVLDPDDEDWISDARS